MTHTTSEQQPSPEVNGAQGDQERQALVKLYADQMTPEQAWQIIQVHRAIEDHATGCYLPIRVCAVCASEDWTKNEPQAVRLDAAYLALDRGPEESQDRQILCIECGELEESEGSCKACRDRRNRAQLERMNKAREEEA